MKLISTACATALAAILGGSAAFAQSAQFAAGTYAMSAYVVSNTLHGAGSCSFPPAGSFFTGQFRYPGPDQSGAEVFIPQVTGASGNYVEKVTFAPNTPGVLRPHWHGAAAITFSPSAGFSGSIPATFGMDIRYYDPASFEATLKIAIPNSGGGTCTQLDDAVFLPSS